MIILRDQFLKNSSIQIISKSGDRIILDPQNPWKFIQWLGKIIPPLRKQQARTGWFQIKIDGKKVGDFQIYSRSPQELELSWIDIVPEKRGRGIAKAVIKRIIDFAKENNYKKISLEAVGEEFSNARKLYESLGFKPVKTISTAEEDKLWQGLELYELSL